MKMLNRLVLVLFLSFSFVNVASSQDNTQTVQTYKLPEGRRCVVEGVKYQCFNLEEYKTLLKIDTELEYYEGAYEVAQEKITTLEQNIQLLDSSLTAALEQRDVLQQERDRLYKKWKKENRLRHEAENEPRIGSWVAWGLAAGEAAVILGMVTALLVN